MSGPSDRQADASPGSIEAPGRLRLANRRGHELVTFRHGARVYTAANEMRANHERLRG